MSVLIYVWVRVSGSIIVEFIGGGGGWMVVAVWWLGEWWWTWWFSGFSSLAIYKLWFCFFVVFTQLEKTKKNTKILDIIKLKIKNKYYLSTKMYVIYLYNVARR